MCVKEFLGYTCGHCSIPSLRACPLSLSNPTFPPCKLPAERPIFTNDYCHPCSRIVWNIKVLKDEQMHREQHLAGECVCEVVFEGEDREKRLRPRPAKGKAKEIRESTKYGDASGSGNEQRGRSRYQNVEQRHGGVRHEEVRSHRSTREETHYDQSPVVPHQSGHTGSGDGVQYGYAHWEHSGAEVNIEEKFRDAGNYGEGLVVGAGLNTPPEHETHNNRGYQSVISGMAALSMHAGQDQGPSAYARQGWDPEAKQAAYQYVGYAVNDQSAQRGVVPAYEQGYGTAAVGGLYPNHLVWQGQPLLNQPGGGMKWYPESSQPTTGDEKPQPATKHGDKSSKKPKTWSKAYSEPDKRPYQAYAESVVDDAEEVTSPPVVSSDMAKPHR